MFSKFYRPKTSIFSKIPKNGQNQPGAISVKNSTFSKWTKTDKIFFILLLGAYLQIYSLFYHQMWSREHLETKFKIKHFWKHIFKKGKIMRLFYFHDDMPRNGCNNVLDGYLPA